MADPNFIAPGTVWLVGAGPGDPELLTRKAERLIGVASVIFHDALVGRGVLDHGFILPPAIGALGLGVMAGALSLPEGGHEAAYTMVGVLVLALGHRLNVMAQRHDL